VPFSFLSFLSPIRNSNKGFVSSSTKWSELSAYTANCFSFDIVMHWSEMSLLRQIKWRRLVGLSFFLLLIDLASICQLVQCPGRFLRLMSWGSDSIWIISHESQFSFAPAGVVGWVLSYMNYIGMCGPKRYGFSAVLNINIKWGIEFSWVWPFWS